MPESSETRVLAAAPSVAAAIRAFIMRDTGVAPPHVNEFPAAPYCTFTWYLEGSVFLGVDSSGSQLARTIIGGPRTRPAQTFCAGHVRAFTVVLYPDAFSLATGTDPKAITDRFVSAADILASWSEFFAMVASAPSDEQRIQIVESHFAGLSDGAALAALAPHEWTQRLHLSREGQPLNQRRKERRVKGLTGQAFRSLQRSGRFEAALLRARRLAEHDAMNWPDLAAAAGYSDQAHLCREFKRMSGATPTQLIARQGEDEEFWIYRHWIGPSA